ncbi:apolipoprotein N-acyltransferase [Nocardioides daphniae]|nr:apolipoprotein N-acyltransferase [Nocardioides daphniae]
MNPGGTVDAPDGLDTHHPAPTASTSPPASPAPSPASGTAAGASDVPRSIDDCRRWLGRLALASTGGAAGAMASAPWELRWLAPLAVTALVISVSGTRRRTAALLGLVFGLAFVVLLVSWMRVIGTDAWLLVSAAAAVYYALLALGLSILHDARARAHARVPRRGRRWTVQAWPLWMAAWWVAVESVMSTWPLGGFPWTRLAWTVIDTPLAGWVPWVGAGGTSFIVALCGSLGAAAVLGIHRVVRVARVARARRAHTRTWADAARASACVGLIGLVAGAPSLLPAPSTGPDWQQGEESVRAAAVQGDVPGAGNDVVAVHRQVTANHVEATTNLAQQIRERQAQQPDFVLWPENSTAVDPFRDERTRLGIDRASSAIGVPVVVGAIVDGDRPDEVLNQGLVWNEQGVVTERYTKRHPVPFGEYIPFRKQLAGLQIGRLDMIPRDMTPGSRTKPLDIAGTKVADLICFDVAFDDSVTAQVRRGAELVTVQTSNASFTGTAQLEQQFAITRFRALETGRTVVVASTNGISGAIGPDGEVLARLEPRTTAVLEVTVPLLDRQTNAVRFGALVKNLIGLIGIGAMVAAGLRLRRGEST